MAVAAVHGLETTHASTRTPRWRHARHRLGVVAAAAVVATTVLRVALAQTAPPASLLITSVAGRDLFQFYCASCHGRDGKGAGPVASALRTPPPDLTTLAARHDGIFASARVESLITNGPEMPSAHGSRDMPVWGPIFRGLDANDRLNRVRLQNIVDYLATIQTR